VDKNYVSKQNVTTLDHPLYSSVLSPPDFFLFPLIETLLKGQRFANAGEVTAKATRKLAEVSKNGLKDGYQKLYERWQKCFTAKGTILKEMLC
jgi:hypothetical protein